MQFLTYKFNGKTFFSAMPIVVRMLQNHHKSINFDNIVNIQNLL